MIYIALVKVLWFFKWIFENHELIYIDIYIYIYICIFYLLNSFTILKDVFGRNNT